MEERNSDAPGRGGRKRAFTLDEHMANGTRLKEVRDFLVHLFVETANVYGSESRAARRIGAALHKLYLYRSEMDNLVFAENENWIGEKTLKNIYYGERG